MTSLSLAEVQDLLLSGESAALGNPCGSSSAGHVLQQVEDLLQQLEEDLGSREGSGVGQTTGSSSNSRRSGCMRGDWGVVCEGVGTSMGVCDQTRTGGAGKGSGGCCAYILALLMDVVRAEVAQCLAVLGVSPDGKGT